MRSFDGLVTDEEAEQFIYPTFNHGTITISANDPDSWTRFDGHALPESWRFRSEVISRLRQAMTLKGARSVVNEVAVFQYVCRRKGCLLGALVPLRGQRYWIFQNYVTDVPFVSLGEGTKMREVSSISDYVSDETRPVLKRDSTLSVAFNPAGRDVPGFLHVSCRHTSVVVSSDFQTEIEQAKGKKYRALYV